MTIVGKPALNVSKTTVVPNESSQLSLAWGINSVPSYTTEWSATAPGKLSGSGVDSRSLSGSKPGKSAVTVTITMTDTKYTFTLPSREVTIITTDLALQGPRIIVAGDSKATWNVDLSGYDPAAGGTAVDYQWSWTGSPGATLPAGSAVSKHLNTTAAGNGTLKVAALKDGQEIASGSIDVTIISRPDLSLSKNNLMPGEQASLTLNWGSSSLPAYTTAWSAEAPGKLEGTGTGTRSFIGETPGNSAASVSITMTDTKYTFTLQKPITIVTPELAINGTFARLAPSQTLNASASWTKGSGALAAVVWSLSSSDEARRATVDPAKGTLQALSAGTITLKASVRLTDTYAVSATRTMTIVDFKLPAALSLFQGDTKKLMDTGSLTVLPSSLFGEVSPLIQWESSRSDVVSVDANGNLTAKKKGTAVITASYQPNSAVPVIKRTIQVTVGALSGDRY